MSKSFSWITCTTSKLEEIRGFDVYGFTLYCIVDILGFYTGNICLPFIRCNRIDQNVTVDIYGVSLWEDGVLILERKKCFTYQHLLYIKMNNREWYLSCCVDQLQMVLLSIYCDHFSKCCIQGKRQIRNKSKLQMKHFNEIKYPLKITKIANTLQRLKYCTTQLHTHKTPLSYGSILVFMGPLGSSSTGMSISAWVILSTVGLRD